MMEPPPALRICGSTARESSHSPRTLMLKVSSHCASRDLFRRAGVKNSSVIEQDVDSAERVNRLFKDAFNVTRLGHIGSYGERGATCFPGCLFDSFFAAADQHNLSSLAGQSESTSAANPAAGAGHDGDFVFQARAHTGRSVRLNEPWKR